MENREIIKGEKIKHEHNVTEHKNRQFCHAQLHHSLHSSHIQVIWRRAEITATCLQMLNNFFSQITSATGKCHNYLHVKDLLYAQVYK